MVKVVLETLSRAFVSVDRNLLIATVAFALMILNAVFFVSGIIGAVAFAFFVMSLGNLIGVLYGKHTSFVNFLIGCFTLISLIIILMGIVVYLMIFSVGLLWIFLGLLLSLGYGLNAYVKVNCLQQKQARTNPLSRRSLLDHLHLGTFRAAIKVAIFMLVIGLGFFLAVFMRTGEAISNVGQILSPLFFLILASSFIIVYFIQKDNDIGVIFKFLSIFLVAFLIIGSPAIVYRNYITEDSFLYVGVIRNVIETGMYGWAPSLERAGYLALISTITVASSAELSWVFKLITPILVSIFVPLFTYLIIQKITKKEQPFVGLVSLLLFPVVCFLSIPLERNIATIFFFGVFFFSLRILDEYRLRNADIMIASLALLATSFLHPIFPLYSVIPLLLSLFLRLFTINRNVRSIFLGSIMLFFMSVVVPLSFVASGLIRTPAHPGATRPFFSAPTLESIIDFWVPKFNIVQSQIWETLPFLYSDNFTWIRYIILVCGIYVMAKKLMSKKQKKLKIWLIMIVLAFWLNYFILRTMIKNPMVTIQDYRFGFFLDMSLIPLAGIIFSEITGYMRKLKIHLMLRFRAKKQLNVSFRLLLPATILLILVASTSVYSGYEFDRIMERPFESQGIGRFVVTDEKLELMGYIREKSGALKSMIVSDNHIGKIALGELGMRLDEEADLPLPVNSGGDLTPYFVQMRHEPSAGIMQSLMNRTNSEIGFFVIGLEDWSAWLPNGNDWIDENAIKELKLLADDWQVFGKKSDLFVFAFEKHP